MRTSLPTGSCTSCFPRTFQRDPLRSFSSFLLRQLPLHPRWASLQIRSSLECGGTAPTSRTVLSLLAIFGPKAGNAPLDDSHRHRRVGRVPSRFDGCENVVGYTPRTDTFAIPNESPIIELERIS